MSDPRLRPHLDGYHDPRFDLVRSVRHRTHEVTERGHRERAAGSLPEAAVFQDWIRAAVHSGIGGLVPDDGAPVPVHNRGNVAVPAGTPYRIERLIFESRPDVFVTANLYVPQPSSAEEKRRPAVLFLCGHSVQGKAAPAYQRACATFAANGYVVLTFDPVGQGERFSYAGDIASGTTEHTYAGLPCWWAGQSSARFFLHDARRGLDLLHARDDVDPERIAVTGNSGGGMLTTLLMALEPRLAVAAPGTYVTSRLAYLDSGARQDAEQILLGGSAAGLDHDAFLAAFAPKPVCVLAANSDFFPIEGTIDAMRRARKFYALFGAESVLELVRVDAPHRYDEQHVDAALAFFNRALNHEPDDERSARDAVVLSEDALRCTRSGQVAHDLPAARFIHDQVRSALRPEAATTDSAPVPAHAPPSETEGARAWLRAQVFAGRAEIALQVRRLPATETAQHLLWQTEPGIWGAGVLFGPDSASGRVNRIVLLDQGSQDLPVEHDSLAEALGADLLESAEQSVLVLDVRGRGVLRPDDRDGLDPRHQASSTYKILSDLLWLGDSLAAGQVFDVVRALDSFAADEVEVVGSGFGAYLARLVAFLDPRVTQLVLDDEYVDPERFVTERLYDEGRGSWHGVIPGLLNRAPWQLIVAQTDRLRDNG